MDIFATIVTGGVVLVLGESAKRLIVEPYHEYRRLVGRIAHALYAYSAATDRPGCVLSGTGTEAAKVYRDAAGALYERMYALPCYELFRWLGLVPAKSRIEEAVRALTFLSNSVDATELHIASAKDDHRRIVRRALGIWEPNPQPVRRPDESEPGGRFLTADGTWVNANGIAIGPPSEATVPQSSPLRRVRQVLRRRS